MKTIKQILESHNIKEDTLFQNYSYNYWSIYKAMEEYGKQSFNAATVYDSNNECYLFRGYDTYTDELLF